MSPKQRLARAATTSAATILAQMGAQLQQIISRGTPVQRFQRNSGQYVRAEDGRRIPLIGSDNRSTAAGKRYFELLGVPPPSLYNYDQPLHNDKWVIGNDGRKILVRKRPHGEWEITPQGENYFKYNRSEYMPRVPYLVAKLGGGNTGYTVKRPRRPDQIMSLPESPVLGEHTTLEYIRGELGVLSTVGQVRGTRSDNNRPLHAAPGT